MKRIGSALLMLMIAALMLLTAAGCNNDGKDSVNVVGTWVLTVDGPDATYQQKEMYRAVVDSMNAVLEFKDDGKVTISATIADQQTTQEGTWKLDGMVLTLTDPTGATPADTFTYKDGYFVPKSGIICLVRK